MHQPGTMEYHQPPGSAMIPMQPMAIQPMQVPMTMQMQYAAGPPPMQPMYLHQQPPPPNTVRCQCGILLSYPYGVNYIMCPRCQSTFTTPGAGQPPPPPSTTSTIQTQSFTSINTNANNGPSPGHRYINCGQCRTLLTHPVTSTTIQCPKCMSVMDIVSEPEQSPSPPAPVMATNLSVIKPTTSPVPVSQITAQQQPSPAPSNISHPYKPSSAITAALEIAAAKKKRRDPNAPKRASNAYMIFCKERRAQLKADRPDLPFGQLGKRLGELWRSMPIEEKQKYEMRASGDRDRYKGQMNEYQSNEMMKSASTGSKSGSAVTSGQRSSLSSKRDRDDESHEYDDSDDDYGDDSAHDDEDEDTGSHPHIHPQLHPQLHPHVDNHSDDRQHKRIKSASESQSLAALASLKQHSPPSQSAQPSVASSTAHTQLSSSSNSSPSPSFRSPSVSADEGSPLSHAS